MLVRTWFYIHTPCRCRTLLYTSFFRKRKKRKKAGYVREQILRLSFTLRHNSATFAENECSTITFPSGIRTQHVTAQPDTTTATSLKKNRETLAHNNRKTYICSEVKPNKPGSNENIGKSISDISGSISLYCKSCYNTCSTCFLCLHTHCRSRHPRQRDSRGHVRKQILRLSFTPRHNSATFAENECSTITFMDNGLIRQVVLRVNKLSCLQKMRNRPKTKISEAEPPIPNALSLNLSGSGNNARTVHFPFCL